MLTFTSPFFLSTPAALQPYSIYAVTEIRCRCISIQEVHMWSFVYLHICVSLCESRAAASICRAACTHWTTPKSHRRPGSDARLVVSVVAAVRNTWFVIWGSKQHPEVSDPHPPSISRSWHIWLLMDSDSNPHSWILSLWFSTPHVHLSSLSPRA